MVETVPQLTYGKVTGRFLAVVADSTDDADLFPDDVPMSGTVTFTPSASSMLRPDATPDPAIFLPTPIVAVLDAQGYVSLNGIRGVSLLATDQGNPIGWTYSVTFALRIGTAAPIAYAPIPGMSLAAGETKDLVAVAPVPASGGQPIIRDETVAINAEQGALAAAADAQYWAGRAEAAAGSGGGGTGGATIEQVNQALVIPHINSTAPHPAYDDMPSLVGYFENGLA